VLIIVVVEEYTLNKMLVEYGWVFGGDKMKEAKLSYKDNEMSLLYAHVNTVFMCILKKYKVLPH